jgi:hypothetical protein
MASVQDMFPNHLDYALERHFTASARLNLQHFLITQAKGYLLHPSTPIKPGMRVADIATGTGVWLLDVADQLPDCELEGWDISDEQFPPESILPKNVRFGIWDAASQVPDHLKERYDVINAAMIVFAIKGNPTPWIQNFMTMLSR